jgi:Heterokaryon incompatibility protein (HET)
MEPIQCTIEFHTPSVAAHYEALSYAWGGIRRHMPISIFGKAADGTETEEAIFATPQLIMARRRLRRQSGSRKLWIDQLYIDQDNREEVGP